MQFFTNSPSMWGGGARRGANKGSCLHSKRGFQLQAPGPWHNLRGQRRGQGEKARHRLLSCSHDDSASWILKKKPSLNCKANQNDTVQLLLLFLHLSLHLFSSHSTATRFLPPSLFQRDDEISCWILIRSYQRAGDRLENVFPRLWTKGGSEQGRGGRGGLYPRVRDVCFVFSCAWIGAERESLLEERSLSQFLSRGCRVNGIESFELEVWSASSFTRSDSLVKNWREWFMRWGRFLSNFSIEVVSPLFFFFIRSLLFLRSFCASKKRERGILKAKISSWNNILQFREHFFLFEIRNYWTLISF